MYNYYDIRDEKYIIIILFLGMTINFKLIPHWESLFGCIVKPRSDFHGPISKFITLNIEIRVLLFEHLSEVLEPQALSSENESFVLGIFNFNGLQVSVSNIPHFNHGHHYTGYAWELSLEDSHHKLN
jgi:hypothetical protein